MKRIKYPSEEEIIFLRGVVNYTEFYLANGKKIISSFTLKRHEEQLEGFVRVNKSHLLNPDFVKSIHVVGTEREVELRSGRRVKVSRRRKEVIQRFDHLKSITA